jgi:hypothetical protein
MTEDPQPPAPEPPQAEPAAPAPPAPEPPPDYPVDFGQQVGAKGGLPHDLEVRTAQIEGESRSPDSE